MRLTRDDERQIVLGMINSARERVIRGSSTVRLGSATADKVVADDGGTEEMRKKIQRETMKVFAEAEHARRVAQQNQQAYRKREHDQAASQRKKLKADHSFEKQ